MLFTQTSNWISLLPWMKQLTEYSLSLSNRLPRLHGKKKLWVLLAHSPHVLFSQTSAVNASSWQNWAHLNPSRVKKSRAEDFRHGLNELNWQKWGAETSQTPECYKRWLCKDDTTMFSALKCEDMTQRKCNRDRQGFNSKHSLRVCKK